MHHAFKAKMLAAPKGALNNPATATLSQAAARIGQISLDEWHNVYNATVGISGNDRMLPFNTTSDSIINSLLETDSIIQSIE